MEHDDLIKKWLNHELSPEELQAFKKLEDYDNLIKLSDNLKSFKAPDYNDSKALESVLKTISKEKQKASWLKPLLRIAAVLAICFSVYYYTTTLDTNTHTLASQKSELVLPDASEVSLNALSTITYNAHSWDENREVILHGEAFFKVAKGSKFNVVTDAGTVTVFGTQFNVKQRDNLFEVICYEGSVGVTYKSEQTKLKPGDRFLILDGKFIASEKETTQIPAWLNNESAFKSIPFKNVIAEFERQYNIKIMTENVDVNELFTGNFTHTNLDIALKSITLPLHLTYHKTDNTITLKRE